MELMDIKMHKHITHKLEQERVRLNDKLNQIYEDAHQMEGKWRDALKQRDQYKAERDTLIDDIAVLKANISRLESELSTYKKSDEVMRKTRDELVEKVEELERENEHLLNQSNYYARHVELGEERLKQLLPKEHNYVVLTSHIRTKAENNPGVSRYIDLVNYIDRLERD